MKKLWILLIFIGVLIMFKPINSIIQDSIGNIIYRGNVVTGIVATDNGDKSYDVFISESDRAYPHIFTLSANPNLAVGDKVRILYKNGCKELPIILPPTTMAIDYIAVYYRPDSSAYNLRIYDLEGNVISDFAVGSTGSQQQWVTVDSNGYIYLIEDNDTLKKYNPITGIEMASIGLQDSYAVDIGNDGYIYTLEVSDIDGTDLKKRNTSDLSVVSSINFAIGFNIIQAFALDSNNYFYTVNTYTEQIEKRSLLDGSLVASRSINSYAIAFPSIGLLSNTLCGGGGWNGWESWVITKTLSSDAIVWMTVGDMADSLTVYNSQYIFVTGWDSDKDKYVIRKYDGSKNLIWEKIIGGIEQYGTIAIGACSYK